MCWRAMQPSTSMKLPAINKPRFQLSARTAEIIVVDPGLPMATVGVVMGDQKHTVTSELAESPDHSLRRMATMAAP